MEEGFSICPNCENTYTNAQIDSEEVVPCVRCYKCFVGDCGITACECVFSDDEDGDDEDAHAEALLLHYAGLSTTCPDCENLKNELAKLKEQMKFLDLNGKPCDRCNEPVCYEGNQGEISKRDGCVICGECFSREVAEDNPRTYWVRGKYILGGILGGM